MKKTAILTLSILMVAVLFAGCRDNTDNDTHTHDTTRDTTHSTTQGTHATSRPTETTRHTEPSHSTTIPGATDDNPLMPGTDSTDGSDSTDSTGRSRRMPRY